MSEPKQKVLVRLFKDDIETLKKFFPERGYNSVIRAAVRHVCKQLKAKEAEHVKRLIGELAAADPTDI